VLLVTLSKPTTDLSLLFDLKQPPNGWPAKTPDVSWAQQGASGWQTLAPLLDTTGNLANPGVVALKLTLDAAAAEAQLRVGVDQGVDLFPLLADLVPNPTAAAQTSQGDVADGGAAVPAQPITTGGSAQPPTGATGQTGASDSQSTAADPAFEMWLAERLRHKTFGVQGWDYAR